MNSPEVEYIKGQISHHLKLFFTLEPFKLLNDENVRFLKLGDALKTREPVIVIPFDIQAGIKPADAYHVEFNNTILTLWNRLPIPKNEDWIALPNSTNPLWYQHRSGTLMPAWNLFGNIFNLLTFQEEQSSPERDAHGRFNSAQSPRLNDSIIEVPAFNEAVAALVGAYVGMKENGKPAFKLDNILKPPVAILSHDCDVLYGNDFWTQFVRASRIFLPLLKLELPKLSNFWWILRNALNPKRFYFDNVKGMIDVERNFGYTSTFYLINGKYGRFGTRSGIKAIKELVKTVPKDWDLGIHYNYNTFLDDKLFDDQVNELQDVLPNKIEAGRAHYLKFDTDKSFTFLESHNIRVDESVGFTDKIGYRAGLGGCYQPYDSKSQKEVNLWEIPIVVMDAGIVEQYGSDTITAFKKMIHHLKSIGGGFGLIFHPGQFFNPEHHSMLGVYHKMLMECRDAGVVSKNALSLVKELKQ